MTIRERASLVAHGGPTSGMTMPLTGRPITLGRRPDNDVVIDEPTVSRRHALIMETLSGFVLRDLGSQNGTFLNHAKIDQRENPLGHLDRIRLGGSEVTLVFRNEGAPTLESALPPTDPIGRAEAD